MCSQPKVLYHYSIYKQTKRKTTNQLDYELLIEKDCFFAYEKNTQSKIELFKCTL